MKTSAATVHPGKFLCAEIVKPLGLDIDHVAVILAVKRQTLNALLRGKTSIDAEMAWRWEQAFDINMDGLLKMQVAYDTVRMRKKSPSLGVTHFVPGAQAQEDHTVQA